jgi:hypothetical protein
MHLMTRPPTTTTPARPRARGRLPLFLGTIATAAVVVVAGLGLLVYTSLTTPLPPKTVTSGASAAPSGQALRDTLAATPMLPVPDADSRGGTPAATAVPGIVVPDSTLIGPARVPSGFPHTPEGAVGQLAAIEIAVLSQMSIAGTGEVYRWWAASEAPVLGQWPLLRHVQSFLAGARMGPAKDPTTTIRLVPAAGQLKAIDGPDWTIACVLLDATVTIRTQARAGFGYCERMQWDPASQRWLIGPGAPPALAPSTWPGTQLAQQAGWLTWTNP